MQESTTGRHDGMTKFPGQAMPCVCIYRRSNTTFMVRQEHLLYGSAMSA